MTRSSSSTANERMVRLAISELFLDTSLDENDYLRLRDILKQSQLSIAVLDHIYYDEIAPLLYKNLEIVAGEWSGFDSDWLESEIVKRRAMNNDFTVPLLNKVRKYWITRSTLSDWQKLKLMLKENP